MRIELTKLPDKNLNKYALLLRNQRFDNDLSKAINFYK